MNSPTRSQQILVGIDGSAASANALEWATALAKARSVEVAAVSAWNYPTAMMIPMVGAPVIPADTMATTAKDRLRAIVENDPKGSTVTSQSVVMGAAGGILCDRSSDHDLLVLGKTGHTRMQRLMLGSTASYCVRHADCPVVIIGDSPSFDTVTVAVDGSEASVEALTWAVELGTEHKVLAVYSHDEWELDDLPLDDAMRLTLDEKADDMLAEVVNNAILRTGTDEARVRRQVRQGDPRTTIVDQADPKQLLVLGAQGHSGLARWALGSLADYAVHHAPGSVVIWRRPE